MKQLFILLLLPVITFSQQFSKLEIARFTAQSKQVTITRDHWGVPHIYGKTDANAVFGLLYAQCEDDFKRVEYNMLEMLGRLSEVEGESRLYDDLQMRLIYDTAEAKKDYAKSPAWFKKLMNASADGVNFYLLKHPEVKPLVLKKFEPWFALMRTDGSISATQTGGLTSQDMKNLYGMNEPSNAMLSVLDPATSLSGSNGFAIGPSRSASKNAILYINPHVTFYFRPEVHMVSDEGLNAYGAVTWGQFFVYQGFNAHCGWMHTSSIADVADLYEETIVKKGAVSLYQYGKNLLSVKTKKITLNYLKDGNLLQQQLTIYRTHHGPVMGARNDKWLSLKENNRSLNALLQSWLRTKATGFKAFEKTMQMLSNNSNNTVFADDKGNIAYWHGNFMPVRDTAFNWNKPVDGSLTATEWKGVHPLNEVVHVYNPATGWIQNCNSTPFTASGTSSPDSTKYPRYMAPDVENFRALNAAKLLANANDVGVDKMIEIGYDRYLAAFDVLLPPLLKAYDNAGNTQLEVPVQLLKQWDRKSAANSVATTLAIEWAYKMLLKAKFVRNMFDMQRMTTTITEADQLLLLKETMDDLEKRFGTWNIAWGEVNRFQRTSGELVETYDDGKASLPSGLASSVWGSLPSFDGRRFANTNKRYGVGGNSFVASVEFGKKVKAKSILAGGQNSNPQSKHFTDQAPLYLEGKFKDVLFYKADVLKHAERSYHPGE